LLDLGLFVLLFIILIIIPGSFETWLFQRRPKERLIAKSGRVLQLSVLVLHGNALDGTNVVVVVFFVFIKFALPSGARSRAPVAVGSVGVGGRGRGPQERRFSLFCLLQFTVSIRHLQMNL
jgi:hypothetical protein